MRILLLAAVACLAPVLAHADPQCILPVAADRSEDAAPALPSAAFSSDASLPPALRRVASAGAQLVELGSWHGLRRVLARSGKQFMFLQVTPDGEAIVAGLPVDMTPAEWVATAGPGQLRELGTLHGLRTLFVTNAGQFQTIYVTPDGQRVVPGAMWDSSGRNLTRDQVSGVPGTVATVEIGPGATGVPVDAPARPAARAALSALAQVEAANAGSVGDPAAPKLWVFVDPLCSYSVRAMQQLRPYVEAKRLQLGIIPVAVLDREDGGRSTVASLAMLSQPPGEMVSAWLDTVSPTSSAQARNRLGGAASPDAQPKLAANHAAAGAIGLRGTPTLVFRRADGTEGREDGVPKNLEALVASLGR